MNTLINALPYLAQGALQTLWIAVATIVLSTFLGTCLGCLAVLKPNTFGRLVQLYVYIIRGIPILILLFVGYFSLQAFGFFLNDYLAILIILAGYGCAIVTEVVRGAVLSVPKTQWLAAQGVGFTNWQAMYFVILPQAARFSIPPMFNTYIHLIKATSFISVVGIWELTLAARQVTERTGEPFLILLSVMMFYYALCYPLALLSRRAEAQLAKSGG